MPVVQFGAAPAKKTVVFFGGGTYTASSSGPNNPAINAGNQDTYSGWRANVVGASWLRIDKGAATQVDAIGIAAHNIATTGVSSIVLEYSNNATAWTSIGTVTTATDEDIIVLFPVVTARYFRLSYTGLAPTIGVFQAAKRLDFECAAVLSYTPIQHSKRYSKQFSNSIEGQFLTNRVIGKGASTEANLMMQSANFVEVAMRQFEEHYNKGGCFFYAGSPHHHLNDMGYCQAGGEDDIVNVEYIEAGAMANVSFSLNVYASV